MLYEAIMNLLGLSNTTTYYCRYITSCFTGVGLISIRSNRNLLESNL